MGNVSRQMMIGYLELIMAFLALPQLVALVPPDSLPYVACVGGLITVVLRFLSGGFGANLLSAAGLLAFAAGILSVPELIALIPLSAMPVVTGLAGVLTLIARYVAGQTTTDPAQTVNALMRTV